MIPPPPSPPSSSSLSWLKERLAIHCTSVRKCKQAHAFLLRLDLLDDARLASCLISFLAISPSGDRRYADELFCRLRRPDLFIWNTMIRGHARGPEPSAAVSYFRRMLRSGVVPDHHTYPFVLAACARSATPELGMRFHTETIKTGLESDAFVLNSLIQMYTSCGYFGAAHKLFDGNRHRDVVSWNVMMKGYVVAGLHAEALHLFDEMRKTGFEPDDVTLISLVSACSHLRDLERGLLLHTYANEKGLITKNIRLGNAILDMYCKCGDLDLAQVLFDEMEGRDLLTWTTMISGLANLGKFQEALDLFGYMQLMKVAPDEVVLVAVLTACSHMGALEQGKYIHLLMDRFSVKCDVVLGTALVDMYAKCGRVDLALQVFGQMKEKNVFTWNALICGSAMHGHGERALELFRRMMYEGLMPDDITFIGLLSACSHAGLVDEGLELFRLIKERYNITPMMEHYGCVVDMLCRANLLPEALDFMKSMPIEPNVVLWATLIGACKVAGNLELVKNVGKDIIELEPDTCDRYVMLSNLYAGARRWDNAVEVRNLMRNKGIKKSPGMSWIEMNGTVHEFVAGDRSHVLTKEIYMMVDEIYKRVKDAGHITTTQEVLFNIEDEEKEHSLFLHSEKLAVAFGLMTSVPGSLIRITKNLRVCSDCHSFFKAVSMAYRRKIIARDRCRFHHFEEGICSCKDFW